MPARERNEDLFEESRMSFGEHIEELRKCLVRAIYGFGLACIVAGIYADEIVSFLQRPLEESIRQFDQAQAIDDLEQRYAYLDPEFQYWIESKGMAPRTLRISPAQLAKITGEPVDRSSDLMIGLQISDGKAANLAKRIIGQDAQSPELIKKRAQAIFGQLDEREKEIVKSMANGNSNLPEEIKTLQKILDRLVRESKIYQLDAFDSLTTEDKGGFFSFLKADTRPNPLPEIRRQVEEENNQLLAIQLNRQLVHSVFSEELTPPRANLVEIEVWDVVDVDTQSLTPHEPFMIWMKAVVVAALIFSSPWIFYQLWLFVSAGLYPHEKRYVHWYLPISIVLFFAGVYLAFFHVMEPVLGFLFSFNQSMGISPQLRINYWLSFVMYMPIGFGIAFQLPLVMLLLNRLGLVEIRSYLNKWRVAVMVIFVASMLLTPADPISMIMLAVPLTILYFLGIGLCKWMPRNQNPFGEIYEPA